MRQNVSKLIPVFVSTSIDNSSFVFPSGFFPLFTSVAVVRAFDVNNVLDQFGREVTLMVAIVLGFLIMPSPSPPTSKLTVCVLFSYRYCVEFEILKASKACRKETNYGALKEGRCALFS